MAKCIQPQKAKSFASYDEAMDAAMNSPSAEGVWFVIVAGAGELEGRYIPTFIGRNAGGMMALGYATIVAH